MRVFLKHWTGILLITGALAACEQRSEDAEVAACIDMVRAGLREIADDRSERFLGKVAEQTALCRGGPKATAFRDTPWVDWPNYWATGDVTTLHEGAEARTLVGEHLFPNERGIDGALMDLEYQRIELIKFNLFDNYTYETYIKGLGGVPGSAIRRWSEMRLGEDYEYYDALGGKAGVPWGAHPLPHPDRNLQRYLEPGHGLKQHAICS